MPVTDAPPPRDAAVSADDLVRCSHSQPGSGQHLQPEILRMRRYYALLGLPLALLAACNTDRPDTPSAPSSPSAAADDGGFSYAIIGDRPYGAAKLAEMPQLISQINADPTVSLVIHVGDIEAGSGTGCADTTFAKVRKLFDTFENPLVYTP